MVGIVILNFNNSAQTLACLDTLYKCCPSGGYKVCVVDNASRPEELEKLKAGCHEEILVSPANEGYARGNDLGLKHLAENPDIDCLMVLNDDTRFTMDILTPMRAFLLEHPECGVVFPLVKAPDGSVDAACYRNQKTKRDLFLQAGSLCKLGFKRREFLPVSEIPLDAESLSTGVPPGSCMMLRKDVFESIGFLDPNTFLYFEEHILSQKLSARGLGCCLMPRLNIIHLGAQTTKKQPSKAVYRHWRNSYLYYLKEYSGFSAPMRLLLRLRTGLKAL